MMVRLGDICTVVSGSTPKSAVPEYWDGDVKWITPAELDDESYIINDSVRHITTLGVTKTGLKPFPAGTVILSSRAPIGKTAIAGCEMYCNQGFKNLICSGRVDSKYLYFFLSSKTDYLNSLGRGATFKEISKTIVENIEIPLPEISEQMAIAALFEKLMKLIQLRKAELEELDRLVKSRFIELFGDPIDNPLNWKVADFKEVVYFQEGPGVRNWQFRDSGIKLINIRNLVDDSLVLENTNNYLSEQEVEEKYKHFLLDVGDYVMASSGVTWGKIAEIYEEHLPLCLNTSIIRLRPYDETVISKKYLFHYIKGDAFRMQIRKLITGSAQPNFGPTHLKKISIIVPPIELQNQFAAFVEQTDKSKYYSSLSYHLCRQAASNYRQEWMTCRTSNS